MGPDRLSQNVVNISTNLRCVTSQKSDILCDFLYNGGSVYARVDTNLQLANIMASEVERIIHKEHLRPEHVR